MRYRCCIAVLICAGILFACDEAADESKARQAPPPPPVTVAAPLQKEITEWDEFTGRFDAIERVNLRARVSGLLTKIHFKDGQLVWPGDTLFSLAKYPFQIAVNEAEGERDEAQAALDLAKSETARARPLAKRRALTERELEQRLAREREAKAALMAAQARLDRAKLNLHWTEIKAPIAGRISDARIDVGNLISGGVADATVLTTIVSLNPIHFVFEGSERDYLKYSRLARAGKRASSRNQPNPVVVKLADEDDYRHEGSIDFIDNVVDTGSGTIRARAIIHNPDLVILPGLFGRLRLFGGKSDAFLIPDAAIASDQAQKIVMAVQEDGTVMRKVVTLGPLVESLRVIRSGLTAKDRIIIKGLQRAQPGQKVTPEKGDIDTPAGAAK